MFIPERVFIRVSPMIRCLAADRIGLCCRPDPLSGAGGDATIMSPREIIRYIGKQTDTGAGKKVNGWVTVLKDNVSSADIRGNRKLLLQDILPCTGPP